MELNGEAFQLAVPMAAVSEPMQLKRAIAQACVQSLGDELTPPEWGREQLDTMAGEQRTRHHYRVTLRVQCCHATPIASAMTVALSRTAYRV